MKVYRILLPLLTFCLCITCIDPYTPDIADENARYLVIDGFINAATGSGTIALTRTMNLSESEIPEPVNSAFVSIESDQNEVFEAQPVEGGLYKFENLLLSNNNKYRLLITTNDNEQYASEFVSVQETPPIDSVTWSIDGSNLNIYVNTHDDEGKSRYYRWFYTETWEYTTAYTSGFKLVDGKVVSRKIDELINRCWRTEKAKTILVESTTRLEKDIVSNFKLLSIPEGSLRTAAKYTIAVEQRTLTEKSYTYWNDLKKTTETLGGLFDPLPAQVVGNLQCITNPAEPVIGYFEIGRISEKRLWIASSDIPRTFKLYRPPLCPMDSIPVDEISKYSNPDVIIGEIWPTGAPALIGYSTSDGICIDCRLLGGSTTKPAFWE